MIVLLKKEDEVGATLSVNPYLKGTPFLAVYICGPMGSWLYLDTNPGTANDLRCLADELDEIWAERAYQENAVAPEFLPGDCAEDARFLGQTPEPF
jgi:hypothetical protein